MDGPIELDVAAFRKQFQQFANVTCFDPVQIQGWWDMAANFVSEWPDQIVGTCAQRVLACNLCTAHIGYIFNAIAQGQPLGVLTSAQIDKVRVDVKPPPISDGSQFQWWMAQSPYGQQLLALFNTMTVGGIFIGGLPERDAFRRVGGGFGGIPPRQGPGRWPR